MDVLFTALWFFLPAGIANVTPIFIARVPGIRRLNLPLDLGLSLSGERLLGANKTWRGLVGGVVLASLACWLQQLLVAHYAFPTSLVALPAIGAIPPSALLGPLLGLGALGGDAVESFFKRRRHIRPGRVWFPFDQIDFILGAAILSLLVVRLPVSVYIASFILWTAIQIAAQYIGFWSGIKERPI